MGQAILQTPAENQYLLLVIDFMKYTKWQIREQLWWLMETTPVNSWHACTVSNNMIQEGIANVMANVMGKNSVFSPEQKIPKIIK